MIWDEQHTEQQRKQAVAQYFSDLAKKRVLPVQPREQKRAARTEKIGHVFRFMVEPSA